MPLLPGVTTPYEIQKAVSNGFTTLKFSPGRKLWWSKNIKSTCLPISRRSLLCQLVGLIQKIWEIIWQMVIVYPWLVEAGFAARCTLEKADYEGITNKAKEALQKFLGYEVVHVGINTADTAEGESVAESIGNVFKMPVYKGELSNFVGTGFEVNNFKGLGKYGHVAIDTILHRICGVLSEKR